MAKKPTSPGGTDPLLSYLTEHVADVAALAELHRRLDARPERGKRAVDSREIVLAWAREHGQERVLTDFCTELLQGVGTLPEPEGTEHRYRMMPPEQLRPLRAFGDYWDDTRIAIHNYVRDLGTSSKPIFLDVGGNKGECRGIADGFVYWLVDLQPRTDEAHRIITADICKPLPIEEESVDVIFSHQVWEHLAEPWWACRELGKVLRPGGLFITITLFAYRYHPLPEDYFRYTHVGLATLHERYAQTETLVCNYDIKQRRHDRRGGGHLLAADIPPIDWLGGFRENWFVYYIGRKPAS